VTELDSRKCGNCAAHVPEGHHYCGQCGAHSADGGEAPEHQTLLFGPMMAPGRAKLILIRGSDDTFPGASWHLNATHHHAGRRRGVILFPDDPTLSPRQCDFHYEDNKLHLSDDASLNGTFVRVRGEVELQSGDRFTVGQQTLRFEQLTVGQEFPMQDGTLMYVSPPRPYLFRVVQILPDGKEGKVYASPNNEVSMGREGCDLNFPEDRNTSRRHAAVIHEGDRFILRDFDSSNGTFLAVRAKHALVHGDYVFIGKQLLRVEITE